MDAIITENQTRIHINISKQCLVRFSNYKTDFTFPYLLEYNLEIKQEGLQSSLTVSN